MKQEKKERKKLFKEIKKRKKLLERSLRLFLYNEMPAQERITDYKPVEQVLRVLQSLDLNQMIFEEPVLEETSIIEIKLNSPVNIGVALGLLYAIIQLKLYSDDVKYKELPDQLMGEIKEFNDALEDFISL